MKTQTATSPTSLNTALTPEDVNAVLMDPDETGVSRSSGRPIAFGYTPDGRYICVVYEGSHVRRDSLVSVMYSAELNSATSSVTQQRTDRHGILDEKSPDFQLLS